MEQEHFERSRGVEDETKIGSTLEAGKVVVVGVAVGSSSRSRLADMMAELRCVPNMLRTEVGLEVSCLQRPLEEAAGQGMELAAGGQSACSSEMAALKDSFDKSVTRWRLWRDGIE